ncbi:odorant receptor 13a-like [Prorops nasuta]|uniref:odorant receptor 13a-like n=1 Tax=Prorops nasuta TaxID=863751 RepID=UPI0034CD6660
MELLHFTESKHAFDYIEVILELITYLMIHLKLDAYRLNTSLISDLIIDMKQDYYSDNYLTPEEVLGILRYSGISKLYIKTAFPAAAITATFWYLRPLVHHDTGLIIYLGNGTEPHALPYRIRYDLLFDIQDLKTYIAVYVCQGFLVPVIFIGFIGTDCLLVTMALHICGQYAVLSTRIQSTLRDSMGFEKHFSNIVKRHIHLIRIGKNLDDFCNLIVLFELLCTTILLCITGYNWIADGQNTNFIIFGLYVITQLLLLLGYCLIGECLIAESTGIADAFYTCEWYIIPPKYVRMISICICRSQYAATITAGRFMVLSLSSFTEVLKTSAAYLSVLRKMI